MNIFSTGYTRGKGFPSVFVHKERDLWTLVHGDDYLSSGSTESLSWLEKQLAAQYEIKTQRIGHSSKCECEGQIQNRVVRTTNEGF